MLGYDPQLDPDAVDDVITNPDSFYPDVEIGLFLKDYPNAQGLELKTIKRKCKLALGEVNTKLAVWQAGQTVAVLFDAKEPYYLESVYAQTFAYLLPQVSVDPTRKEARQYDENLEKSIQSFENLSTKMINRIKGVGNERTVSCFLL